MLGNKRAEIIDAYSNVNYSGIRDEISMLDGDKIDIRGYLMGIADKTGMKGLI